KRPPRLPLDENFSRLTLISCLPEHSPFILSSALCLSKLIIPFRTRVSDLRIDHGNSATKTYPSLRRQYPSPASKFTLLPAQHLVAPTVDESARRFPSPT